MLSNEMKAMFIDRMDNVVRVSVRGTVIQKYVLLVRRRLGSSQFFLLNSIKAYDYELKETRWEGGTDALSCLVTARRVNLRDERFLCPVPAC